MHTQSGSCGQTSTASPLELRLRDVIFSIDWVGEATDACIKNQKKKSVSEQNTFMFASKNIKTFLLCSSEQSSCSKDDFSKQALSPTANPSRLRATGKPGLYLERRES